LGFHHLSNAELVIAFVIVQVIQNVASLTEFLLGIDQFSLKFAQGVFQLAVRGILLAFDGDLIDEVSCHVQVQGVSESVVI
jgi:hypothetical protein